jgi:hypothetical protein
MPSRISSNNWGPNRANQLITIQIYTTKQMENTAQPATTFLVKIQQLQPQLSALTTSHPSRKRLIFTSTKSQQSVRSGNSKTFARRVMEVEA